MYVYVVLAGENENEEYEEGWHIFRSALELKRGDVVKAPLKMGSMTGLVVSAFRTGDPNMMAPGGRISSILGLRDSSPIKCEAVEEWFCALIKSLREGNIGMDDLVETMGILLEEHRIDYDYEREGYLGFGETLNEHCKQVFTQMLPEAMERYLNAAEDERKPHPIGEGCTGLSDQKLALWKSLKDCESLIENGHLFFQDEEIAGLTMTDPVELTDDYLRIELDLIRLIEDEVGKKRYMGYCHAYWREKQRILRSMFGIEWKSPAELNPDVMFD